MIDFQILIVEPSSKRASEELTEEQAGFAVRENSRRGVAAIAKIDELAEIWEVAVEKLASIAARTKNAVENSPYELETIEFSIGIEAGLSIGLVTKGDASVSISFKKRDTQIGSGDD
jgi:hypothetical protein